MTHSTLRRHLLRRAWFIHLITCVSASAAPPALPPENSKDTPTSAENDAPPSPVTQGILLGGGLGGVIPGGKITDDVLFDDVVDSFMIGRLDAGYRFNEYFLFGAYTEGGLGIVNTNVQTACDEPGIDCSASLVRLGLQARAYYPTTSRFQPWGGAGFGYEWFGFSVQDDYGDSVRVRAKGAERLRLTLGLDIWGQHGTVGSVLVGYTLGKYSHAKYSDTFEEGSIDLGGGTHHSVTISGTYNLML